MESHQTLEVCYLGTRQASGMVWHCTVQLSVLWPFLVCRGAVRLRLQVVSQKRCSVGNYVVPVYFYFSISMPPPLPRNLSTRHGAVACSASRLLSLSNAPVRAATDESATSRKHSHYDGVFMRKTRIYVPSFSHLSNTTYGILSPCFELALSVAVTPAVHFAMFSHNTSVWLSRLIFTFIELKIICVSIPNSTPTLPYPPCNTLLNSF